MVLFSIHDYYCGFLVPAIYRFYNKEHGVSQCTQRHSLRNLAGLGATQRNNNNQFH